MKLVFRADASREIGTGHVMRCAAIAEEAMARGIETELVGSIVGVDWLTKKVQAGLFSSWTPPAYATSDNRNALIIDSYNLNITDKFIQTSGWFRSICLVDLDTPLYHADSYIGFLDKFDWPHKKFISSSKIHFGVEYNPVRLTHKKRARTYENSDLEIVVIGGGADISNFAEKVATILLNSNFEFNCKVFGNIDVSLFDSRFSKVMYGDLYESTLAESDLVITAAGSTVWELCVRGIAFGVVCIASNQEGNFRYLSENKLAHPIGNLDSDNKLRIDENSLYEIVSNLHIRNQLRLNLQSIDLGHGASLICDLIFGN